MIGKKGGKRMGNGLLPLYNHEEHKLSDKDLPIANIGLWYNKFFNQWEKSGEEWKVKENGKLAWLKSVQGVEIGSEEQLQENIERYIKLIRTLDGELLYFKNTSSFVIGIGNAHPIENGFTWHYNLGLPYLPSSSIKGMVRAWAKNWDTSNDNKELIYGLLGAEKSQDPKTGDIIFFDALPVKPVKLEADIMTVHYNDYYSQGSAPGDWENPIPIPFLTVSPHQQFILGIVPRNKKNKDSLSVITKWLSDAFNVLGIGAKTAVGYGLFEKISPDSLPHEVGSYIEKLNQEIYRKDMTPLQIEMEEDGYSDSNHQIFMGTLNNKWLNRMETNEEEAQEIAQLLADWYLKRLPEQWEKPINPKNKDKVRRIKKALLN